ncbi:MAG: Gfo/Idh/MocA family oxidoreductase, partial [Bacteroidales bacterium]|nr:Gfo/Idh/MocA family oxidoreductase [Bacteroidales bacterium]
NSINRRDFLSSAAVMGAAGTLGAGAVLTSCGGSKEPALVPLKPEAEWNIPQGILPDKAKDGAPLKAGVIGCGGRGRGAAQDFLNAASNVSVVALGDVFQDRVEECRKVLKEKFNQEISDDMCFTGFDNYEKVIAAGVDVLIIATPPAFRPIHFKAAVDAGKHVFLEKPLCVDPIGARSVIATSKKAISQGLCVITGTQRHHQRGYIESYKQIQSGLIGDIVGGQVYWNQSMLWYRTKEKNWTDVEWMIRDWVNWTWLSGDHIVEQHVHNIDVFNWFTGLKPVNAVAFGARQRRLTGDQYDMFSVDYTYEGGIHMHSMCRQIDGCKNNVSEFIQGSKGSWTSQDDYIIKDLKGNELWKYDKEKENADFQQTNPYVLEHVNWINHIRDKKPVSQAEETAISTLTAVMGRISAYTGAEVTWDQMMASDLNLMPENLELKNMDMKQYAVAVPGKAKEEK